MRVEEAKREIFAIKRRLIALLKEFENVTLNDKQKEKIMREIFNLYHEYLKIYVQVGKSIPDFINKDNRFRDNNCYFYALDLSTPPIFTEVVKKIIKKDKIKISNEVGTIADFTLDGCLTKDNLLERVYADLDALKIKTYDCDINSLPSHEGYKVAIYIDENPIYPHLNPDYHFIRQNSNGTWSQKYGYYSLPTSTNASEENVTHLRHTYEYVKTLEIVKPTIRR